MSRSLPADDDSRGKKIAFAAVDTLLWQALASVIIPGFTINRICALSLYTMGRTIPNVSLKRDFCHINILAEPCKVGEDVFGPTRVFITELVEGARDFLGY